MRWMSVSSRRTGCGRCGRARADGRRVLRRGPQTAAAVTGIAMLAALAGTVAPAPAAGRVALVIGNSAYTRTSLVTPVNDASDMASALRGLGFDVVLRLDADEDAMDDALGAFGERSAGARRRAGVLRGLRPGDGRCELPDAGGRASGERRRCSVRDRNGGGCSRVDGGRGVSSRDLGRSARQPVRTVDAASGGADELPCRAIGADVATGADAGRRGVAGGICGHSAFGHSESEQSVHRGVAAASGYAWGRGACDVPRRVGRGERGDGKPAVGVFVVDWRALLGGKVAAARGGRTAAVMRRGCRRTRFLRARSCRTDSVFKTRRADVGVG